MRPSLMLLVLLGPLLLSRSGFADEAAEARARSHNESAKRLFALGMFREAAEQYKQAYRESPKPAFLFNLGQCYKRLPGRENLELARFYFKGFLRQAPDSPLRAHVEGEVARLNQRLAQMSRTEPSPVAPAEAPSKPIYKRWWFWTLIGAAVTGAVVGTAVAARPGEKTVGGTADTIRLPNSSRGWP